MQSKRLALCHDHDRVLRSWPSNATGWVAEVQYVGCNDSLSGQLLRAFRFLCCTWSSWPERDFVHSDTVKRRSAASMTETWALPPVVAAAVLQLAHTQGRTAQFGSPQQRPRSKVPSVKVAVSLSLQVTVQFLLQLLQLTHLVFHTIRMLLVCWKKVAELKLRMSARLSLCGLLADKAAKRAGNNGVFRRCKRRTRQ